MSELLRRSASFWRAVAVVAFILGLVASIWFSVQVARVEGYYGGDFDGGAFVLVLGASILGLLLSLGLFFMVTRIMDGLAELIRPLSASVPASGFNRGPVPAAAPPAPAAPWAPTHQVPAGGMAAWARPNPAQEPVARLAERVQLRIDEIRGAWARVTGVNGWSGWVDFRLLAPLGEAVSPETADPAASPDGSESG